MARKEKPFLGFAEAHGWQGLAGALRSLGIPITADALQALRRRHNLPWVRGGGQRGKAVWFDHTDIDEWARFLTGKSTAKITRAVLRRQMTGKSPRWKRRRHKVDRGAQPIHRPLYVVLAPAVPGSVDFVLRDDDGGLYATPNWFEAEAWTPPKDCSIWLYQRSALATLAERTSSPATWRPPPDPAARTLIGAFRRRGGVLRWLEVPLRFFKGVMASPKATTPFLSPKRHRGYAEAYRWLVEHEPDAIWVKWWDRARVIPGTLESARPYEEPPAW
jgi:hypothetical protein